MKVRNLLLIVLAIFSASVHAKRFRNAYVSFELPPNWNCKLEGSEWVCQNDFAQKAKEAIIILTAKEVGPSDSLAAYKSYLETPRMIVSKSGAQGKSQVLHVKERTIQNQMWIDGMHLGSEVGPYYTRYLATIKDRIAILVTFSAHKEHYTKYSGDFMKAIESLGVVATKDILSDRSSGQGKGLGAGRNEVIGVGVGNGIPLNDSSSLPREQSRSLFKRYGTMIWLIILAVAVGAIIFFVYGNKKPKKPSGRK